MKRTLLAVCLAAANASAATFLVPSDAELVRASKAIVVATAGTSASRFAPGGWIETVTEMRVDEAIKGPIDPDDITHVTELGGIVNGLAYVVPGSPRYGQGERVLLFLETNSRGEWCSKNMAVGKFSLAGDRLLRDATSMRGWDYDGSPHREPLRAAQPFLRFVRETAAGRASAEDYFLSAEAGLSTYTPATGPPASTYLLQLTGASGTLGLRWNRFPSAVVFLSHGTQPGALNGGLTALQRGLAAWSSDPNSDVIYQYGGTTAVSSTGLISGNPDGVNSIQFNDPSNEIAGSYTGSGGDTLAIGGAWASSTGAGSTHTFAGETFYTIFEADLVVQDGITGAGISGNGFDHVMTHELDRGDHGLQRRLQQRPLRRQPAGVGQRSDRRRLWRGPDAGMHAAIDHHPAAVERARQRTGHALRRCQRRRAVPVPVVHRAEGQHFAADRRRDVQRAHRATDRDDIVLGARLERMHSAGRQSDRHSDSKWMPRGFHLFSHGQ